MLKRLNLGCGNDYKNGFVNLDCGNCKKDVDHNIENTPYPFGDNEFELVFAQHVLEHVSKENFVNVVRELYRICANGATIQVAVPHGRSNNFLTDFTHKMPFTTRTFDFFDDSKPLRENGLIYGCGDIKLKVLTAMEAENLPNGPDIRFVLQVIK